MVLKRKIIVLWDESLFFRLKDSGTRYRVKFPIQEPCRKPEPEKTLSESGVEASFYCSPCDWDVKLSENNVSRGGHAKPED
jgi:hypothetical protein